MGKKKLLSLGFNTPNGQNHEAAGSSKAIIFALLSILLIPAFQGVHNQESEFFFMHLISAASIFLILLIVQDETVDFLHTKLDYLLCFLVGLYLLSIFWSDYPKLAWEEALKYLNYFLVFWLMAHVLKTRDIKLVIKTLYFIGVLMAVVAFIMMDGEDLIRGERLVSTLTYANAFSAYVAAMIVLGYYLIHIEEKSSSVYILSTYILTLAFIGSQSRIMWLIFFPGILFFGVGFPEGKRKCLLNIISVTVLAFVASFFIFEDYRPYLKVGVFLVGAMTSCGLSWGMSKVTSSPRWAKIFFTMLALTILLGVCFFAYQLLDPYDSENNIVYRLESVVDLDNPSVQERVVYYRDAFKIMRHGNFLGGGGGAWQIQHPLLRSYCYWSLETHSHFCKTGIETGLIGLGLFMGVFIFVAFYLVKKRKDAETWTVGMAFLFIYLHSLFDFDLSFGFMALVAWILLGLFNHKIKNAGGVFQERKIPKLAAQRFLLLYFLLLLSLTISFGYSSTIEKGDGYDQVRPKLEKAIILYPLNAENYASLGDAHYGAYFRTRNPQYLVKAVEMSEQALKKGYNNYSWFMLKAKCLIALGELDSVLRVLEEGRPYMGRFENNIYTRTADFYRQVAEKAGKQKKTPLVRRAYEGIIVLWEQAQAEMATVDPRFLNKWEEEETLVQSDDFLIEVIHAYIELGNSEKAKELLTELSEQTFNKNPWLKEIA